MVGNGIFMSTIHSAKGMEFPHVFVLDGDWSIPMSKARMEEERRVMYVAMTRAEETLHLMKIQGKGNPFLKEIKGDFVMPLTYHGIVDGSDCVNRKYDMLGLDEIYLDYAGSFPQLHPIHNHLAYIEVGHCVSFRQNNSKIEVYNQSDVCLARLSNEGANKWRERQNTIMEVRVVAMLRRNRDDPDESFQKQIKADNWGFPVLEVVHSPHVG